MKKLEDILAQCIEDVRAGRATVEECLELYASLRKQLEPLLKIALSIEAPGDIKPSPAFKIKARVNLMEQIHARKMKKKRWWFGFGAGAKQPIFAGSFRVATIIIAVLIAVSALGGGTAYASQDSLPGDNLYTIKLGTEQVRRTFTFNESAKVNLELAFAKTRLQEMEIIVEKRPDRINMAISGYENNIGRAIEKAEQLREGGASANMSEVVASTISEHLSILDRVEGNVPEEDKAAIRNVRERISNRQPGVLRILARENPVRAAKINLYAIQSWLGRAKAKAEESEYGEVEAALHQFEVLRRFGNEISQAADGDSDEANVVNEMNARATSRHLAILGDICNKVPEQRKGAVERAMRLSLEGHYRAIESLKESGVSHNIPEKPPLPEGIPDRVKERILKDVTEKPQLPNRIPDRDRENDLRPGDKGHLNGWR